MPRQRETGKGDWARITRKRPVTYAPEFKA